MSKLYVNIDESTVTHPFLKRISCRDDFCEEMLYPFIDIYSGMNVTDLMINTFCQLSTTPSEIFTDYIEKYNQKKENGIDVDYTDVYNFANILKNKHNIDYSAVWFKRCWEKGIRPWLSVRMNDCHEPFEATAYLRSEFFYEAQNNGWMLGEEYGYFRNSFNYSKKEVRAKMLDYIREQIETYDVFGLELDFMREMKCFRYLHEDMDECRNYLTEFISDVRKILNKAEKIHGHYLSLLVRVPRDIEQSRMLGFDVEKFARYADVIVPTPRFRSNDSGIRISEWKKAIQCTEICAGIETLLSFDKNLAISSAEIISGLAASFLADGSDGIYLYNLFIDPDNITEPQIHPYVRNTKAISAVGSGNLYNFPLRFAVINQNDEYIPGTNWHPLPFFTEREEKSISVITGNIPKDKAVSLIIGFKNNIPIVSFNNTIITHFRNVDLKYIPGIGAQPGDYVDDETQCIRYDLDNSLLKEKSQTISFGSEQISEICWIEIDII